MASLSDINCAFHPVLTGESKTDASNWP